MVIGKGGGYRCDEEDAEYYLWDELWGIELGAGIKQGRMETVRYRAKIRYTQCCVIKKSREWLLGRV
jgi:hypothetical protein